ncbi:MAG: hypothetical protein WAU42_02900 [Solirubrobacteraceae bacterium]
MTAFFVAGIEGKGKLAEDAYSELRERSLAVVGCPARSRRIFKLSCRFDGSDTEIEVGRRLASGSDVVAAILDHGREEAFVVHTDGIDNSDDDDGEVVARAVRVGRPVYSVTEFS